ncbi:MAG: hypothetical protein ACXW11_06535 [Methylotenera sp.]
MNRKKRFVLALCIFGGMDTLVHTQQISGKLRGELLYSTYCNACHTLDVHWCEQKLATD